MINSLLVTYMHGLTILRSIFCEILWRGYLLSKEGIEMCWLKIKMPVKQRIKRIYAGQFIAFAQTLEVKGKLQCWYFKMCIHFNPLVFNICIIKRKKYKLNHESFHQNRCSRFEKITNKLLQFFDILHKRSHRKCIFKSTLMPKIYIH